MNFLTVLESETQGLVHAGQVFYHWATSLVPDGKNH
jgi:hypothetical protein